MRIMFCIPAVPVASNHSGAASRVIQSFGALTALRNEVHVVRIGDKQALQRTAAFEEALPEAEVARKMAAGWLDVESAPGGAAARRSRRYLAQLTDPIQATFPAAPGMAEQLQTLVNRVQPELVWADTSEIAAAVYLLQVGTPWVFSHHDWLYRVRRYRWQENLDWRMRWLINRTRSAEMQIYRAASVALSGSRTDVQRLEQAGCRRVSWIPLSYDAYPPLPAEVRPAADFRVTHLGSTETTANRLGLQAYFDRAHERAVALCRQRGIEPQLWLLGDLSRTPEPLAGQIRGSGATLTGYVTELAAALRPFDLSIIPYEHDTGFRTKLPLLFRYAQVLVATRISLAGSWVEGMEDVCCVVESVNDFPEAIAELASDPVRREALGRRANEFFNAHFTHAQTQPLYKLVLDNMSG